MERSEIEKKITKTFRGATHDQVQRFADFISFHPWIPSDEILALIQKHWRGDTTVEPSKDRKGTPHHNQVKGASHAS